MDDRVAAAFQRFKSLSDDMLSCLCQNLKRNILRYKIALDQSPQEFIFRLRRCRESDFDLFETDLDKEFKKLKFRLQIHRNDQCLVAVTKVNRTPDRRLLDRILLCPFQLCCRGIEKLLSVLIVIHHIVRFLLICSE